jgi:hypothetical protein
MASLPTPRSLLRASVPSQKFAEQKRRGNQAPRGFASDTPLAVFALQVPRQFNHRSPNL